MISKLVRRNIANNKGRLALMLLSIVLGVSFVSGSFILADSLRAVFGDISEQIFDGTDVQVRGVESDLAADFSPSPNFDEGVWDAVRGIDGIEYAEPGFAAFESVYTIGEDGSVNRPPGPPVFANSWGGDSLVSPYTLEDGRGPSGQEIAIDVTQSRNTGLGVGDSILVSAPGLSEPESFEIVGIVSFGGIDGAYFNLFDLPTMQRLASGQGELSAIAINVDDDVRPADMVQRITEALGPDAGVEAVLGTTLVEETNADFGQIIDIIGWVLLGFAIAVLFVSIFIIYNTFAILIGQRIRQFGLLRSIGATGGQLTRMVLIEALIMGVLASVIGFFGGIGIAELLKWLFSLGGGEFPDGPLLFKPRTFIVVFGLGIGVTLASALLPSQLAQRIPALAALRDGGAALQSGGRKRRIVVGGFILVLGAVLLALGLFGSLDTTPRLAALGFGAALLFIGVAAVSVMFASAATRALGAPVEAARGLRGRLARDNASRNPQRTAATATALMIGLALITGVMVLTQSLQVSLNNVLDEAVAADLLIFEENQGLPFAAAAIDELADTPGVADVAGVTNINVRFDGESTTVAGIDLDTEDRVLDIRLEAGSYAAGDTGVLLFDEKATELGLAIGDEVNFEFEDGFTDDFTIVGLFGDTTLTTGAWVLDRSVTGAHSELDNLIWMGVTYEEGADPDATRLATTEAMSNYPQLSVQDNAEFKESQEGQIRQILFLIFGLLALSIVVAFIGIVNTMALSILERTREIGLVRAVGMSRRQLRSSVRWEAIIVSVFGALLGVILGLIIGYAAVTAIPDSFISEVSIPWVWAIVFTVIGGLLGMVAAVWPARRAARMNVLDAISHY